MNTDTPQTTARIYQFPVRARTTDRATASGSQHGSERRALNAPMSDIGSGWYHDVAIRNEPVGPHAG